VFQQAISGQMVQDINNGADGLTAEGGGLNAEAYEKRCKEKLRRDLASEACCQQGPLKMGRDWVESVEDTYSEVKGLGWASFLPSTKLCLLISYCLSSLMTRWGLTRRHRMGLGV
jgi:hypothetical protein